MRFNVLGFLAGKNIFYAIARPLSFLLITALPLYVQATPYVINGNGTVTDAATGLIWMRCSMGQQPAGDACSGAAGVYTWHQAIALTHTFAGQSDWRLPTVRELGSITDRATYNPAIDVGTVFPATPTDDFWTKSAVSDLYYAWSVGFRLGDIKISDKSNNFHVRLVRGGQADGQLILSRPASDYVDHGNGTVTHMPNGLMWQRCAKGQTWTGYSCNGMLGIYGWLQARSFTDNFAGQADWRLPTQEELLSLVDYTTDSPSLNSGVFPNTDMYPKTLTSKFWSASDGAFAQNYGWGVDFSYGQGSYYKADGAYGVRLVRDASYPLTVNILGSTGGSVVSSPSGIDCDSSCLARYPKDAAVTLAAMPSNGLIFTGWGGACSGAGSCMVTLDAAKAVSATFTQSAVPTATAVEYFHAGFGHYFITASPEEVIAIDQGTIRGWARTGETFKASLVNTPGASNVCRFFSVGFSPKSSHFYTPAASECAAVKTNASWQYEGLVFSLFPLTPSAMCSPGFAPLYRLYNNGISGAPNHRYTTKLSILNQQVSLGWSFEGDPVTKASSCVPN